MLPVCSRIGKIAHGLTQIPTDSHGFGSVTIRLNPWKSACYSAPQTFPVDSIEHVSIGVHHELIADSSTAARNTRSPLLTAERCTAASNSSSFHAMIMQKMVIILFLLMTYVKKIEIKILKIKH